jgi:soluble lytic murein transglycosylase
MFTALGSPRGALLGLVAAALIIAITYSLHAAPAPTGGVVMPVTEIVPTSRPVVQMAEATIDDLITGSTGDAAPAAGDQPMPGLIEGSAKFVDALGLLQDKKYADAYAAARGLSSDVERRTIQWAAITYGNGEIAPETVLKFEADAPDFVNAATFKTRLEQALIKADAGDADII